MLHVPEPVLFVQRVDRREENGRVARLHVIDGCQALGLSVSMKYERNYGDNDVQGNGVPEEVAQRIADAVVPECTRHREFAPQVRRFKPRDFT